MLCIKLHPPNIENAPPSEPKLHPLTRFLSKLESFAIGRISEPYIAWGTVFVQTKRHSLP